MKTKSIKWWNSLPKSEDVDSIAIEGDNVVLIDGIAFLIQRKNNFNNVVCWRVKATKTDIVTIFCKFRKFCQKKQIQYTRVEGIGKHRYKMLYLVLKRCPESVNIVYSKPESKELGRHIWYIKNY